MAPMGSSPDRTRRRAVVPVAMVGALALAVWATWPLARHACDRVYDAGVRETPLPAGMRPDVYLTQWVLAWDVHALGADPLRLLNANAFHPAPLSLACSEHVLGALPLYLPLALFFEPVCAHQLTLVLTFACAFVAAFVLVRAWTGASAAALLAGVLFAFSPFRINNLGAIQIEGNYFLPLVVLCMWRTTTDPQRRWPFLLALVLTLQALHSYYLGFAAFTAALGTGAAVVGLDRDARRAWLRLSLTLLCAALLVSSSALPYLIAKQGGTIVPPSPELVRVSSSALGSTGSGIALVVALATVPWWRKGLAPAVRPAWLVGLAAAAVVAHALALGPEVRLGRLSAPGPFAWLAAVVPPLETVRVTSRFNAAVTLASSVLASIGALGLLSSLTAGWSARAAKILVPLAMLAIALTALGIVLPRTVPLLRVETRASIPPVYRWLASAPVGPVVEIPFWDFRAHPFQREVEARRLYRSVYHWHPLLNGYAGYTPRSYDVVSALARALPDPRALTLIARMTGLRYVVVHRAELSPAVRRQWADRRAREHLRAVALFGSDVVLEVDPPATADLVDPLLDRARREATLLGTSLAELDAGERRVRLELVTPAAADVRRGLTFSLDVSARNDSRATWPAISTSTDGVVFVSQRWLDLEGNLLAEQPSADRLPYDLRPGETVRIAVPVTARVDRPAQLYVGLSQGGIWFDQTLGPFVYEPVASCERCLRLTSAPGRPPARLLTPPAKATISSSSR